MNNKTLIFLHGGPGLPDYLEGFFKNKFEGHPDIKEVFYTQTQNNAKTVETFIDELNVKVLSANGDVFLVGHSWGGFLAAEFAFRNPHKVSGLVLISSAYSSEFKGKGASLFKDRAALEKDPLLLFMTNEEIKVWRKPIQEIFEQENVQVYNDLDLSYLTKFDNTENFRSTKLPILNIYGDEDYVVYSGHQKNIDKFNKSIKSVKISGAGHFPFLLSGHRNKVIKAIKEFIEG